MNNIVARVRREPLVWFLLAGLSLFCLHALVSPGDDVAASRVIEVDRDRLLQFMQLRARSFNERGAGKFLEQMSPQEVATMVKDMVREEAMYREGLRLGLDKNDYVMRRRLVQSLEYLAEGAPASAGPPDEAKLKRYYAAHRDRYVDAPSISFSHIFFSADAHGWEGAQRLATDTLAKLNAGGDQTRNHPGDRFLYLNDYIERTPEIIESHFGQDFAERLLAMAPQGGRWQGPLRSKYGFHLVRIASKDAGRLLPFEQVRAIVAEDAAKDARAARREAFADGLIAQFKVDIDSDLQKRMTK
ncbi:peptidylprolyl isomerase [Sphingobium sp. AN558]|uniref:peptidylprolyl isomerase n=1 Tax=Sphingobium sp. AN558 TaxID=3133442 RepID=UPI0030C50B9F